MAEPSWASASAFEWDTEGCTASGEVTKSSSYSEAGTLEVEVGSTGAVAGAVDSLELEAPRTLR